MTASLFALQDGPDFERFVFRTVGLAAGLGAIHGLFAQAGAWLPTWFLAPYAVLLSLLWEGRADGWTWVGALIATGASLPALTFGGFAGWVWFALCAGGAVAASRWWTKSKKGAAVLPGRWALGAAVAAGPPLAWAGEQVARTLHDEVPLLSGTVWLGSPLAMGLAGLFLSLCALPVYLRLGEDPVLELWDRVAPELAGRLSGLARRAVEHYRDCQGLLQELPPDPSRAELSKTLVALGHGALTHAAEWSRVERELSRPEALHHEDEATRLRQALDDAADPVARSNLEWAVASHEEEAQRLEALRAERVRALARMEAEVALLARARGSLSGIRTGHAQLRSAELAALSRKLGALSEGQSLEATLMGEVARGAELDQLAAAPAQRTRAAV